MPNIFIATPATRPFESEFVLSLYQTRNRGSVLWYPLRNRPVAEARNKLAQSFLSTNGDPHYDFILFADSDATWHPDAVERMAERNLPAVTAGIYRRKLPPMPTIGMYAGRNPDGHHTYEFASVTAAILDYAKAHNVDDKTLNALCLPIEDNDQGLLEVDGCGAHFLMVRRDVLEAVHMPWFHSTGRGGGGEDFYFCRKVKEAGYPIYLDLSVHTGHLAGQDTDFGIRELLAFYKYVKPGELLEHDAALSEVMDVG